MIITVLEARITPENEWRLKQAYQNATKELSAQLVQTYLMRNAGDRNLWQIVTVWQSREAYAEMQHSMGTPKGVAIFRAAGVEPKLMTYDVESYVENRKAVV